MDRLDLDLLKLLLANNGVPPGARPLRRSFRSMARDLGVDQGTVRSRMKKLQGQRVLKGWYLGVSPGVTGHDVVYAWLTVEPESRKDEVIRRLLSVKEVERVCNYLGPKLSLVLFHEKGTDPNLSLDRLAEVAGVGGSLRKQAAIQVPARRLRETDAAIVALLREDPWMPYSRVASDLRLSSRTVKRRAESLAEGGAIYMLPVVDLKSLHGIIPTELVVDYDSGESRARVNASIMSRVKENLVFSDVSGPHGYFALAVSNVSQVEQIAEWARRQKGVSGARSEALQDVVLNRNHYEQASRPVRPKLEREEAPALR